MNHPFSNASKRNVRSVCHGGEIKCTLLIFLADKERGDVAEDNAGFVVFALLKINFSHLQLGCGRLVGFALEFGKLLELALVVTIELFLE